MGDPLPVCLYIIITVCKSQKKTPLDFNFFLAYNEDVEKEGENYGHNDFKAWNCSFYRYCWCVYLFQCCELLGNKLPSFLLQLPLHLAYMVNVGWMSYTISTGVKFGLFHPYFDAFFIFIVLLKYVILHLEC